MKLDDYIQEQILKSKRVPAGLVLVSVNPALIARVSDLGPDYRAIPMVDTRASMARTRSVAACAREWKVVAIRAGYHPEALSLEADIVIRVDVKANELVASTLKNRGVFTTRLPDSTPVTL